MNDKVRCGTVELVDGEVQALGCIEYKVTKDILKGYLHVLDIGNE